jgi:hypothetical protein
VERPDSPLAVRAGWCNPFETAGRTGDFAERPMTISLDSIIRTLTQIEAEYLDTAERLAPIIRLLAGEAARLVGNSPAGVVYWLEHGLLPGFALLVARVSRLPAGLPWAPLTTLPGGA